MELRTTGGAAAFVPSPLPPDLDLSWPLVNAFGRAEGSIGYLGGVCRGLPDSHLLVPLFVRREAGLSSRLEGKQKPREVMSYVAALEYGLVRMPPMPNSLQLSRELHGILSEEQPTERHTPSEFRPEVNYAALEAFERFLHAESHLPALIRLAVVHYQFEAIYPFLDDNGRVGRLLITLLLHTEKLLDQRLLYLSAFFDEHRDEYNDRLFAVSSRGAWGEWLDFFLRAVHDQANDAVERAIALLQLRDEYRRRITVARQSVLLLAMIDRLFQSPAVTITGLARDVGASYPAAKQNVEKLVAAGILEPLSDTRNKVYMAREILALIE